MLKAARYLGSILLLTAAVGVSPAAARDACQILVEKQQCTHATALDGARTAPEAALSAVEGDVVLAGERGYTPVRTEAGLRLGDRAIVFDGGSAVVRMGTGFRERVGAQSLIDYASVESCACLRIEREVEMRAQDTGPGLVPIVVVGTGVGLGIYFLTTGGGSSGADDDDNDSPSMSP